MRERIGVVTDVFAAAFRNPDLRNVGFAYALFSASELGTWIILLVYAYDHGGPSAELGITVVQLVPSMLLAPAIGAAADRWSPDRSLVLGYAAQALTIGGVAVAIAVAAPTVVVYLLAPLTCFAISMTRPSQSALLPSVVRTAEELTAANVMTGWTEGAAALFGPGLAGILLGAFGQGTAVAVMGALTLLSMVLALQVSRALRRRATGPPGDLVGTGDAARGEGGGHDDHEAGGFSHGLRSGLRGTLLNPDIRVLLVLTTFYFVLIGAMDYLCVVLALGILHMGPGGAGYLNAAIGVGALVAGFLTAFLVGRHPLARTLALSLVGAVAALALVAVLPRVGTALVLFAVVGLSLAVFNATGKTLMQRAAPPDAIAGTFGILESLMDFGLLLGSLLIWAGIRIAGPRTALVVPALAALVLVAVVWRRLKGVDETASIPQVEIRLLRSLRIFAPLPAPALEAVARELTPMTVPAGTRVVTEGEPGDTYFAIADGELEVTRGAERLARLGRGDGFGEIALIRDLPRTATVTTVTDSLLYALDGDLFVETVTGNAAASRSAVTVVDGHLGTHGPDTAGGDGPPV
jgi:MFS family permease